MTEAPTNFERAKPGDWVYQSPRGPIPLPPLDRYNPSAEYSAEWSELAEELDAMGDNADKTDEGRRVLAKFLRVGYRMLKDGVPEEYRARLSERATYKDVNEILSSWGEHGATAGK